MFIPFVWVHSGAPLGSLGSFGRALGIVVFIPVRKMLSGALLCVFGFFAFIRARPESDRVQ